MAILNTSLQTTATVISPVLSTDMAITVMFFCNNNIPDPLDPNAGKQFIDIYVVPSGGSAANENRIANQIPIDAGDTFTFGTERLVLSTGETVYASATDNNIISATISYVVI